MIMNMPMHKGGSIHALQPCIYLCSLTHHFPSTNIFLLRIHKVLATLSVLQSCDIQCRLVMFNLDPPKLVPPITNFPGGNQFFWNIWIHSETFVPTIGQPHESKSVTTLVEFRVAYLENYCFSWVCLSSPMQRSKRVFVTNHAQCRRKLSVACGHEWDYSTLCAAELTGLSSSQKAQKPSYIRHWSKFWKWNMFQGLHYFICGRWSKYFSGSPYFAPRLQRPERNYFRSWLQHRHESSKQVLASQVMESFGHEKPSD